MIYDGECDYSAICAMVTLLCRRLLYATDMLMTAGSSFVFETAAKPLHAVRDVVTDSLANELFIALSNGVIADPYDLPFSPKMLARSNCLYWQMLKRKCGNVA